MTQAAFVRGFPKGAGSGCSLTLLTALRGGKYPCLNRLSPALCSTQNTKDHSRWPGQQTVPSIFLPVKMGEKKL